MFFCDSVTAAILSYLYVGSEQVKSHFAIIKARHLTKYIAPRTLLVSCLR